MINILAIAIVNLSNIDKGFEMTDKHIDKDTKSVEEPVKLSVDQILDIVATLNETKVMQVVNFHNLRDTIH